MVFIKVLIIVNISTTYMWFHQPKMSIIPEVTGVEKSEIPFDRMFGTCADEKSPAI